MIKLFKLIYILVSSLIPVIISTNCIENQKITPTQIKRESIKTVDEIEPQYLAYTTFNMNFYFKYLYQYSPVNSDGSCGFVSLIQVMSYYDTFYNDNVISEVYDRTKTNATTLSQAKKTSPGVVSEGRNPEIYPTYYDFCSNTYSYNFQSKLTIIYNNIIGTNQYNFENSLGIWNYQSVLNSYYGNSQNVIVNSCSNLSNAQYINIIRNNIDSKIPVIVHIRKTQIINNEVSYLYHSVVAYDYDDSGIYANFGWGNGSTHKLLLGGDYGYDTIYYIGTLDFSNMGHLHSDNYIISGHHYCGCNQNNTELI